MARRTSNSAIPVLAGTIAAMAFAMGAIAHDAGYRRGLSGASEEPITTQPQAVAFSGLPTRTDFAAPGGEAFTRLVELPAASLDGPAILLVIDDIGADEDQSLRALDLPAAVSFAVLPNTAMAPEFAAAARARGQETLIHMPMQPQGDADPGPDALRPNQSEAEMRALFERAMARVPGARGFNNHMGSALTVDEDAMARLFAATRAHDLYFLDSLTAGNSVAGRQAEYAGITALSRDIFIDHVNEAGAIADQLRTIEAHALERGHAVAIGHPRELTLDALEAWIPDAEARGFRFVPVGAWLETRDEPVRLTASGEAPGFPGGAD